MLRRRFEDKEITKPWLGINSCTFSPEADPASRFWEDNLPDDAEEEEEEQVLAKKRVRAKRVCTSNTLARFLGLRAQLDRPISRFFREMFARRSINIDIRRVAV